MMERAGGHYGGRANEGFDPPPPHNLLTNKRTGTMTTMKSGGAILPKENGAKEVYSTLVAKKKRIQYSFRDIDGTHFSYLGKSLFECRKKRDEWLVKKSLDMSHVARNLIGLN